MESTKLKIKIDASALVKSSCWLRFKRIVVDGYRSKHPYNDTQYGSAFHKFISTMFESNGQVNVATEKALELFNRPCVIRKGKEHLNAHHLLKTCFDYWTHFKKNDNFEVFVVDGKPLVEVDFCIPIFEDENYIVELTGTIDKIGKFVNGCNAIGDYKTHSLWVLQKNNPKAIDAAANAYFKTHEMNTQLRFYLMNLRLKALMNPDSEFSKICQKISHVFIDGVFISGTQDTLFRRSEVFPFKDTDIEEFKQIIYERCRAFLSIISSNPNYSIRDGLGCGACVDGKFPCDFNIVCDKSDEKIRQMILKSEFIQKSYNPLEFSK